MRIAIITTSYPAFLRELYAVNPGLENRSYAEQMAVRNDTLFGFADFYSRGFQANGHEAAEFHFNNPWLQGAWARENGLPVSPPAALDEGLPRRPSRAEKLAAPLKALARPLVRRFLPPPLPDWQLRILQAQIAAFQPDVIYNQEPAALRGPYLRTLRQKGRCIVGQIASALPPGETFRDYDLMVSSLPGFVTHFRTLGVPSAYNRLAFEPSARERIGTRPRDIPVSFVGNLSRVHDRRVALLEHVARRLPLQLWGTGLERLSPDSPLHACFNGPAWGRGMLEILARSQITLNNHETVAGNHANNLRLYEGTGMGSLLLTDRKGDLADIFVPGDEVAVYDSLDDCVAQAERYLGDTSRCEVVAAAGLARMDRDHSYHRRAAQLLEIFRTVLDGKARSRWMG